MLINLRYKKLFLTLQSWTLCTILTWQFPPKCTFGCPSGSPYNVLYNFWNLVLKGKLAVIWRYLEILVWKIKRIHDWRWIKEPMKWFKTSCTTKSEQIPIWLGVCKSRNFFCELLYGGYWVSALYALPVFPPERVIAGIPHYNQTWLPENEKRVNLALSFYKTADLTQA